MSLFSKTMFESGWAPCYNQQPHSILWSPHLQLGASEVTMKGDDRWAVHIGHSPPWLGWDAYALCLHGSLVYQFTWSNSDARQLCPCCKWRCKMSIFGRPLETSATGGYYIYRWRRLRRWRTYQGHAASMWRNQIWTRFPWPKAYALTALLR